MTQRSGEHRHTSGTITGEEKTRTRTRDALFLCCGHHAAWNRHCRPLPIVKCKSSVTSINLTRAVGRSDQDANEILTTLSSHSNREEEMLHFIIITHGEVRFNWFYQLW